MSRKKGKKSEKKEGGEKGLSVGDNCLLYTSFTIFELTLSRFLVLLGEAEEEKEEEEGGRKEMLDGLLWSGVRIVSHMCGKRERGEEEEMEVEKCFQSLSKVFFFFFFFFFHF